MTTDLTTPATWRKSTYSSENGGNCVEAAGGLVSVVPVRDSKDLSVGHLAVPAASWTALTASLRV